MYGMRGARSSDVKVIDLHVDGVFKMLHTGSLSVE
jgi:hypothetical protein